MKENRDWLWDRKFSPQQAKAILKDPGNPHFLSLASLLFARKNNPQEVLKTYLTSRFFLLHWRRIKRQMRKDNWNNPRIIFWQAIFEKLKDKYQQKGEFLGVPTQTTRHTDEFYRSVGEKIKLIRKQKGLTQKAVAQRLKVSQQIVSRIETGRENLSLRSLKNIAAALDCQLQVDIFG